MNIEHTSTPRSRLLRSQKNTTSELEIIRNNFDQAMMCLESRLNEQLTACRADADQLREEIYLCRDECYRSSNQCKQQLYNLSRFLKEIIDDLLTVICYTILFVLMKQLIWNHCFMSIQKL